MNLCAAIALDATLLDEPETGIGLYTRELAQALEARGLHVVRMGARRSGEFPRGATSRTLWTLGELPRALERSGAALYHAFGNFNLPLTRRAGQRYVLTVHDLIPELMPETVSRAFHWQFRLWLGRSLQLADRVVCVSETTRRALLERYNVEPENVRTVYNGVDHVERVGRPDAAMQAQLRALELPETFVLFAGAWDTRKNLALLLEAFARLQGRRQATLVLVGQPWFGSSAAEARVAELRDSGADVRPLGFQPAPILYELMRRAAVFVFPSLYEGFGLPPLEAMRLGCPAIISDRPALPEICGSSAVQVPADDAEALAAALARLLASPEERRQRAEEGLAHARAFTWARAAEQLSEIYRELGAG